MSRVRKDLIEKAEKHFRVFPRITKVSPGGLTARRVFLCDKPGEQPQGWAGVPAQTCGYSTGNGQGAAELRAGPGEQPQGWAGVPSDGSCGPLSGIRLKALEDEQPEIPAAFIQLLLGADGPGHGQGMVQTAADPPGQVVSVSPVIGDEIRPGRDVRQHFSEKEIGKAPFPVLLCKIGAELAAEHIGTVLPVPDQRAGMEGFDAVGAFILLQ